MSYSVLGTGLMGAAVARSLIDGGHRVTVWNRTTSRAEPLAKDGATVCTDVRSAIESADTVILLLLDQTAALEALAGNWDGLRGKTLINLMTGTPEEAVALGSLVIEAGARYLDGAVECYPSAIGTHEAIINCSGDVTVWAEHAQALKHVAGRSAFVGEEPGAANVLDAALAGTFHSVALGALCEAFAFLQASGIDPSAPEIALDYWLDFLKEEAIEMAGRLAKDDLTTTDATLSVYLAAIKQWRSTMLNAGQRASLMTAHMHNLEIAEATGCGELAFISQVTSSSIRRA